MGVRPEVPSSRGEWRKVECEAWSSPLDEERNELSRTFREPCGRTNIHRLATFFTNSRPPRCTSRALPALGPPSSLPGHMGSSKGRRGSGTLQANSPHRLEQHEAEGGWRGRVKVLASSTLGAAATKEEGQQRGCGCCVVLWACVCVFVLRKTHRGRSGVGATDLRDQPLVSTAVHNSNPSPLSTM